mgnify:CR=1 FL=1
MQCSQCGNPIQDNVAFCSSCGHPVHNQAAATSEQPKTQTETHPLIEKGTEASKNYWDFVVENLKSPVLTGVKTPREQFSYGYINLLLLALFFGLGGYFHLKELSTGFFAPEIPFFETFFTLFFYGAGASLVAAGAILIVVLFLMNASIHFHDVIARFGALATVPMVMMAFYFFTALVALPTLSTFAYLFLLAGLIAGTVITLYSFKDEAKANFDPFYGIMITFAIFALYLWLTKSVLFEYLFTLFLPSF